MDPNESADDHPDKVRDIDMAMPTMSREVRNVLHPVPLQGDDCFQFRCYPGIVCFNACCHQIEIVLTPYDIVRLRHRLNLSSEAFLHQYTDPGMLPKGQLPVAIMRMDEATGRCPFNTPEGCTVYSDRPVTCRYYPIGLALMRKEDTAAQESFYFLIKEGFCKGHQEANEWSVADWRDNQGAKAYDAANRKWLELIIKRRSAGDMTSSSLPLSEVFYMASTSAETMRHYIFDSTFLQRYAVDPAVAAQIREDDAMLIDFAMDWLKSVLFGDPFYPLLPGAKGPRSATTAPDLEKDG